MKSCTRCNLHKSRTQVVLPILHRSPLVCFLGECPGKKEDEMGLPFVGAAGKWHQAFVRALPIGDQFIVVNVVNCRPTKLSKFGNVINAKPTPGQVQACSVWLEAILKSYNFKLLVLYGQYPIMKILEHVSPVGESAGHFYKTTYPKTTDVFACYHPATLVYNKKHYLPFWKEYIKSIKHFLK